MSDLRREYKEDEAVRSRAAADVPRDDGWDSAPLTPEVAGERADGYGESPTDTSENDLRCLATHERRTVSLDRQMLTADDRRALSFYTSPARNYEELNDALRDGTIDRVQAVAADSAAVTRALRKLERCNDVVYRGVENGVNQSILDRYTPGSLVIDNAYTSATRDPRKEFGGNVLWTIKSTTGRIIGSMSDVPDEDEVLFDRFSKFKVLERRFDVHDGPIGRWHIAMLDVS